jgi:hypothetical protein
VWEEMRPEFFRFALMTVPHADNASGLAAGRPDKIHQPRIQPTDSDVPRLAIVEAVVRAGQVGTREDFRRSAHIKAAIPQGVLALCGIAGDTHGITVATIKGSVKCYADSERCRLTTELSAGWLAEADHGHFIDDGQRLAYQVPLATRALQRLVRRHQHHVLELWATDA